VRATRPRRVGVGLAAAAAESGSGTTAGRDDTGAPPVRDSSAGERRSGLARFAGLAGGLAVLRYHAG
jgi:hypothetical protein